MSYNYNNNNFFQPWGQYPHYFAVPTQPPPIIPETQYEQPSPTETAQHEKDEKRREGGKETKKRERWSEEQSKVLVSMYVEKHEELESSRCNQVWPSILKKVNQQGSPKTKQQCRIKIRNLKADYKRCKDKNKESGSNHHSCPFYEEFDAILGTRNVISMPEFGEVGVADEIAESPGSPSVVNLESTSNKRKIANLDESFEGDQFLNELEEMQTAAGNPKKKKDTKPPKKLFQEQMIELQKQQIELFKNSEENYMKFQRDMLREQLEAESRERENDRQFFLRFGEMLGRK